MNVRLKSGLKLFLVAALVGTVYVWVSGIPRSSEEDLLTIHASQSVPAPGPGQKKVVLQNLGMT